jgi:hypothetical protein
MVRLCANQCYITECLVDLLLCGGVALAAYRYQRLDLIHQCNAVLAVKTP